MPDDIRKRLIGGMGDYARTNRLKRLRDKYGTGVPALDEVAESTARAGEDAQMPSTKKADLTITIAPGSGGNSKLKDDATDPLEDEEFQKWLAKQGQ